MLREQFDIKIDVKIVSKDWKFFLSKVLKNSVLRRDGENQVDARRGYSIGWEEIGRLEQVARLKFVGGGGRDVQHEGIGGVQTESQNAIRRHYGAVIIRGVVRRSEIARNVLGTMSKMSIIRGSLYLRILKHFGIDTSSILLGHPFKFYSPSLIRFVSMERESSSQKDSYRRGEIITKSRSIYLKNS